MGVIVSESYSEFTAQVSAAVKAGQHVEIDATGPGFYATVSEAPIEEDAA